MIEKTILDYLNGQIYQKVSLPTADAAEFVLAESILGDVDGYELIPVPVYMEVPETPPDVFVTIEKTGSGRENHINSATFAVQSYAETKFKAAELNDQVKTLLDDLITLPEVTASRLNSDYDFTDNTSKRYRYQAVYDIYHY